MCCFSPIISLVNLQKDSGSKCHQFSKPFCSKTSFLIKLISETHTYQSEIQALQKNVKYIKKKWKIKNYLGRGNSGKNGLAYKAKLFGFGWRSTAGRCNRGGADGGIFLQEACLVQAILSRGVCWASSRGWWILQRKNLRLTTDWLHWGPWLGNSSNWKHLVACLKIQNVLKKITKLTEIAKGNIWYWGQILNNNKKSTNLQKNINIVSRATTDTCEFLAVEKDCSNWKEGAALKRPSNGQSVIVSQKQAISLCYSCRAAGREASHKHTSLDTSTTKLSSLFSPSLSCTENWEALSPAPVKTKQHHSFSSIYVPMPGPYVMWWKLYQAELSHFTMYSSLFFMLMLWTRKLFHFPFLKNGVQ